ncbi:hypothetical protein BDV12DRAFT_129315 [Aspergillus spectabilis]
MRGEQDLVVYSSTLISSSPSSASDNHLEHTLLLAAQPQSITLTIHPTKDMIIQYLFDQTRFIRHFIIGPPSRKECAARYKPASSFPPNSFSKASSPAQAKSPRNQANSSFPTTSTFRAARQQSPTPPAAIKQPL